MYAPALGAPRYLHLSVQNSLLSCLFLVCTVATHLAARWRCVASQLSTGVLACRLVDAACGGRIVHMSRLRLDSTAESDCFLNLKTLQDALNYLRVTKVRLPSKPSSTCRSPGLLASMGRPPPS
jgi:hypothetical protein